MAKKKVIKKVVNEAPVVESNNEVIMEMDMDTNIEVSKPNEPTIFDKHRGHINTVKEGYLKKLSYADAMEILRYVQDKTGHRLGLNMSCASCLMELVQIFTSLEGK